MIKNKFQVFLVLNYKAFQIPMKYVNIKYNWCKIYKTKLCNLNKIKKSKIKFFLSLQ